MGSSYYSEMDLAVAQDEAKKLLKDMKCTVHKRKGRVSFDFDDNGCNAYIKCCCVDYAKQISDTINKTQLFNKIVIEDITNK